MENQQSKNTQNSVRRISSLGEHRSLLKEVFQTAKKRIVVVSPFISSKALTSDYIPSQVKSATSRGVSVLIFTDRKLNCDDSGSFKSSAQNGITDLTASGAQVRIVEGIHNKTLARDEDLIAEGSFNWLSAVRVQGGENQREERTMVVQGEQAKNMIEKELTALDNHGAEVAAEATLKIWKPSLGLQIFRWAFAIGFMLFMLTIALGAKDKGVSFLAYVGVAFSVALMGKFLKKGPIYYRDVVYPTSVPETEEDDDESYLIKGRKDSLTKAGYIGVFERRDV